MMRRGCSLTGLYACQRRFQGGLGSEAPQGGRAAPLGDQSGRDKARLQDGADTSSGAQQLLMESPGGWKHFIEYNTNNGQGVEVPVYSEEDRRMSDVRKEQRMIARFGKGGPGEHVTMTPNQEKRNMLQKQEDVDGMPWEVRWKKSLIPTAEELVQEMRDRFELYEMDPMQREVTWYLHWKDRLFNMQPDRQIWPQGYTDYFDHYDENGVRRSLPTSQKWTDQNWKHLSDQQYKDRMWLASGEEHKVAREIMEMPPEGLIAKRDEEQLEQADLLHGMAYGVIDPDPDQTHQVLAGTADPLQVARTKRKVHQHQAELCLDILHNKVKIDVETGSPITSGSHEMLPSGVTVAQASVIELQTTTMDDSMLNKAEMMAHGEGDDKMRTSYFTQQLQASKDHGNRPVLRSLAEKEVAHIRNLNLRAGFIEVPTRPRLEDGSQPEAVQTERGHEVYYTPKDAELQGVPEWYQNTLVSPGKPIMTYNSTQDPIESHVISTSYHQRPPVEDETNMVLLDEKTQQGDNAFDEVKIMKQKNMPELSRPFKPLPTYQAALLAQEEARAKSEESYAKMTHSERLAKDRKERRKPKKDFKWDSDMVLPDLPWETDPIIDPYRAVSDANAVDFNKKQLREVFDAYKNFLLKRIVEFRSVMNNSSPEIAENVMLGAIDKIIAGQVGTHPECANEHLDVFKLSFEAHARQFVCDWYVHRGNKKHEADGMRQKAEQLQHRAAAKSKLLGENFMKFIQEVTANELDAVKKSPQTKYKAQVQDKKHEIYAKPYEKVISALTDFVRTEYSQLEQVEIAQQHITKILIDSKLNSPQAIDGVSVTVRDALVDAFFFWCKGTLAYWIGKKSWDFYLQHADSRFRARAEECWEESYERYQAYFKCSVACGAFLPIPNADPPIEYGDDEYMEGESASRAEIKGDLDTAERLWTSGTRYRWYPMLDETDHMLFYERRGKISLAIDISDRCLENMNKKTHPKIHPFPDSALKWLEGAPKTQETTEHLWLRHMADLYMEHADFCRRMGRFGTEREYKTHAIGMYRLALKSARERIPATWSAPLLTQAKYLMAYIEQADSLEGVLKEVEVCIDKMYGLSEMPTHWVHRESEMHYRLALFAKCQPLYVSRIIGQAQAELKREFSNEDLANNMAHRERTGRDLPQFVALEECVDKYAAEHRKYVLSLRDREKPGSDHWHMFNHYYFQVRVRPKTPEEVSALKEQYWTTYDYIYTYTCLQLQSRSIFMRDAVRKLSQIMIHGNLEQRKFLLGELKRMRQFMPHAIDADDVQRAIVSLERNLEKPGEPVYITGTAEASKLAAKRARDIQNMKLRQNLAKLSEGDYKRLQLQEQRIKAVGQETGGAAPMHTGPKSWSSITAEAREGRPEGHEDGVRSVAGKTIKDRIADADAGGHK